MRGYRAASLSDLNVRGGALDRVHDSAGLPALVPAFGSMAAALSRYVLIASIVLSGAPDAGAELLQGAIENVARQPNGGTNTIGSVWGQAFDEQSQKTTYQVRICIDQAGGWCPPGAANSVTLTANAAPPNVAPAGGANWNLPMGAYGSINLKDGAQHYLYPWIISKISDDQSHDYLSDFAKTGPGATCCGFPVRWDAANGNLYENYAPNTTASFPATPSQMAVWADTSQAYSVGSSGPIVCAGGTTATGTAPLLADGVAGYFVQKHAIPCGQVYETAINGGGADTIATSTFSSEFASALGSLPSSIQYNVIGWMRPDIVTGTAGRSYGITAWFTMWPTTGGAEPNCSYCLNLATGMGQGPSNPWFNSGTDATPLSTASVRPSIMLAAGTCPTCTGNSNNTETWTNSVSTMTAVIDAATAAIGTNPVGMQSQTAYTSDSSRNGFAQEFVPSLSGTAISASFSNNLLGSSSNYTSATVTSGTPANNLLYANGAAAWNYDSNFGFRAGAGFWTAFTSFSAALDTGQTPWISALGGGIGGVTGTPAIAAGALAVEPCESAYRKALDLNLFQQYYAAGWDVLQAFWKAQYDPWGQNLTGDPFAQPFSARGEGSGPLTASPASVTINDAFGSIPSTQTVTLSYQTVNQTPPTYTSSSGTNQGAGWIGVSPASATMVRSSFNGSLYTYTATVTIRADPTGVAAGSVYTGTVTISSGGIMITIPVTMNVGSQAVPQPTGGIANAAGASQAMPSVVSLGSYSLIA